MRDLVGDDIEAEAWADMIAAAPLALADGMGLRTLKIAEATLVVGSRIPRGVFNRAIGLRDPAAILAIRQAYREAGAPVWWIHAADYAPGLAEKLEASGLVRDPVATWAKMGRGPGRPEGRTDLAVRELRDRAIELASVLASVHGMPPALVPWTAALMNRPKWTVFAAFDGDTIVAGGMLYVSGDQAWLGLGGTLPTHRGRGAQGAIMAARIRAASEAGCTQIFTETGEPAPGAFPGPSLRNMYRFGFEKRASRHGWGPPAVV
jgi:hypothetical protein